MTISLIVICFLLVGCLFCSQHDRKEWNGGICKENWLPWEYFDTDSQGGRGYRAGDVYCWQSWGHDK